MSLIWYGSGSSYSLLNSMRSYFLIDNQLNVLFSQNGQIFNPNSFDLKRK